MLAPAVALAASLAVNGSFERPRLEHGTESKRFDAPARIGAWTVVSGNVDLVRALWVPAKGSQSLDLNGDTPGAVEQQLQTVPGGRYLIVWRLAGNPLCGPPEKTIRLVFGGTSVQTSFDTTGQSTEHMGWRTNRYELPTGRSHSDLRFESLTEGACGPAIDGISVTRIG
jgi:choice-of-anchor C domain-containing protein